MPATAGRVPMPAGNRVVTGNALKVSDRWSSIVGSDPYASEKKEDGDVMEKLWADQRLHGNKRKIGTDERGIPIFEMLNGAEKREKRKGERRRRTRGGEETRKRLVSRPVPRRSRQRWRWESRREKTETPVALERLSR